jgi:hypothetical protein
MKIAPTGVGEQVGIFRHGIGEYSVLLVVMEVMGNSDIL